eukprot:3845601-Pyramimonas_sp.AAC.2
MLRTFFSGLPPSPKYMESCCGTVQAVRTAESLNTRRHTCTLEIPTGKMCKSTHFPHTEKMYDQSSTTLAGMRQG